MAVFTVITLFACEANIKEIQQLSIADIGPIAQGEGVNLKYTDSGKLIANLITPKLLDYSNYQFPFYKFPEGIEVHFWNDNDEKSIVTADYAVHFDQANLVDLRNNVVLITSDSVVLKAEQLYWDQKSNWVFTDQPYQILFKDGSFNEGNSFDSNEDFTNFISRKNTGVQLLENNINDE